MATWSKLKLHDEKHTLLKQCCLLLLHASAVEGLHALHLPLSACTIIPPKQYVDMQGDQWRCGAMGQGHLQKGLRFGWSCCQHLLTHQQMVLEVGK